MSSEGWLGQELHGDQGHRKGHQIVEDVHDDGRPERIAPFVRPANRQAKQHRGDNLQRHDVERPEYGGGNEHSGPKESLRRSTP